MLKVVFRQLGIISSVYNEKVPMFFEDFMERYEVSKVTLFRDLKEIRKLGIQIKSRKNKGLEIHNRQSVNIIKVAMAREKLFELNAIIEEIITKKK